MKNLLLFFVCLTLVGCSTDPLAQIYEGTATEHWQLLQGNESVAGNKTSDKISLSFSPEGEGVTVFISGLRLKSSKAADGKDLQIPEQVVKRKVGELTYDLTVDGTVSLRDGKASLDLVGVTQPEDEASGSYGLSFEGSILKRKSE